MFVTLTDAVSTAKVPGGLASCEVTDGEFGDLVRVVPGRLLGSRPLRVEAQVDAITALQEQLSAQQADHEQLKADLEQLKAGHKRLTLAFSKNQLRRCAGQILSIASEFLHLKQTSSTRTQCLDQDHPGLSKLATMASKTPAQFSSVADGIITRRNNDGAHFTSIAQLDDEVEVCKDLIEDPAVKQHFKWEAWVIVHYEEIKTAFPDQFGVAPA